MAESILHTNLVREIINWVKINCSSNDYYLIQSDLPENKKYSKPPLVLGFYPDVFVNFNKTIIGEAKTRDDINNHHTIQQINAYLKYLSKKKNSLFIFACPWEVYEESFNLINKIQQETEANNVEIQIIN